MNGRPFDLAGARLVLLPSGGVHWPETGTLIVSDLHLGKSERMARRGGPMLPPYETRDTLRRLAADLAGTGADRVVSLGDSFDDLRAAKALDAADRDELAHLAAQVQWIWITGNHDPGSVSGGTAVAEARLGPLTCRHIAQAGATAELSGHYHPKARLSVRGKLVSRPCLIHDTARAILPAYGTYTGGLDWTDPALACLFAQGARAILTGPVPTCVPLPRAATA
ncbi:ligase-associated DNA damage response endonuclease PdeM [Rhodobacteraceae bacterium CCMM004]|nr:ligase-associated DNA damage response endonuclease PdeM [Rhodobacteraceae bacterium CCMM004]